MGNFTLLFKQAYVTLLKKWIPGLRYIYVSKDKIVSFETKLRKKNKKFYYNTHCVSIDDINIAFYVNRKNLYNIERAIIDITVLKVFEYSKSNIVFSEMKHVIKRHLPFILIASIVTHDIFSDANEWNTDQNSLSYFGYSLERFKNNQNNDDIVSLNVINSVVDILYSIKDLVDSTNEGKHFPFLIGIISNSDKHSDIKWIDMYNKQFVKSMSSKKIAFILNTYGEFIGFDDISNRTKNFDDYVSELVYEDGCSYINNYILNFEINNKSKDIFFISTNDEGDVFIYKNATMLFFMRRNSWYFLNEAAIQDVLSEGFEFVKNYENSIVKTILDMLINKHGCCLGIFNREIWHDEQLNVKIPSSPILKMFTNDCQNDNIFWNKTREIRQRLLSVDGAVLLEAETGMIYTIGAIIRNTDFTAAQGGRTTAAQSIASRGGLAIKVSDDGYVEIYMPHRKTKIKNITPSFTLGK